MHRYSEGYSRASKLTNALPRVFIHAFGVYFGVFEAFGRLQDRGLKMSILDLSVISFIHMFIMLLALNFQWSSRSFIQSSLDQESTTAGKKKTVWRVRDSLALHNLRLSKQDRLELDLIRARDQVKTAKSTSVQHVIRDSKSLQNFFKRELAAENRKHKTVIVNRKLADGPPEQESPTPKVEKAEELDFSFLGKVRQ